MQLLRCYDRQTCYTGLLAARQPPLNRRETGFSEMSLHIPNLAICHKFSKKNIMQTGLILADYE